MTRIVTLGDSITLGLGDPRPEGGWRGWACLLAEGLPKPELHNLAAEVDKLCTKPVSHEQFTAAVAALVPEAQVVTTWNTGSWSVEVTEDARAVNA